MNTRSGAGRDYRSRRASFTLATSSTGRVDIYYEVADSSFERLRYSPTFFNYGKNVFRQRIPDTIGYAGFRIHYPINKPDVLDEVFVFLGASYFRAVAKDLIYGPKRARTCAGYRGREKGGGISRVHQVLA